ncbi:MAG: cell division protein ZipA [Gammaproteobacteria bacterium]|nr:cell division protein ZipA [Gammaproteobacteria bacterium]
MSDWELRVLLLVIGIIILIVIYTLGKKKTPVRVRDIDDDDLHLGDDVKVSLSAKKGTEDDPTQMRKEMDGLDELVREEVGFRSVDSPRFEAEKPSSKPKVVADAKTSNETLVVLNVAAKGSNIILGSRLMSVLNEIDVEYGEHQVFHRYTQRFDNKQVLFSLANMIKPGIFELDKIEDFTTPGVSFYMVLPGPVEGLKAFNIMLDCAQTMAERLDGELLDESRSILTKQGLERMREEIQLFSVRQERAAGA